MRVEDIDLFNSGDIENRYRISKRVSTKLTDYIQQQFHKQTIACNVCDSEQVCGIYSNVRAFWTIQVIFDKVLPSEFMRMK